MFWMIKKSSLEFFLYILLFCVDGKLRWISSGVRVTLGYTTKKKYRKGKISPPKHSRVKSKFLSVINNEDHNFSFLEECPLRIQKINKLILAFDGFFWEVRDHPWFQWNLEFLVGSAEYLGSSKITNILKKYWKMTK